MTCRRPYRFRVAWSDRAHFVCAEHVWSTRSLASKDGEQDSGPVLVEELPGMPSLWERLKLAWHIISGAEWRCGYRGER